MNSTSATRRRMPMAIGALLTSLFWGSATLPTATGAEVRVPIVDIRSLVGRWESGAVRWDVKEDGTYESSTGRHGKITVRNGQVRWTNTAGSGGRAELFDDNGKRVLILIADMGARLVFYQQVARSGGSPGPNGQLCRADGECTSGYCYPGPDGENYCLAKERNCAVPESDGAMYGERIEYRGEAYECFAPPTGKAQWRAMVGSAAAPVHQKPAVAAHGTMRHPGVRWEITRSRWPSFGTENACAGQDKSPGNFLEIEVRGNVESPTLDLSDAKTVRDLLEQGVAYAVDRCPLAQSRVGKTVRQYPGGPFVSTLEIKSTLRDLRYKDTSGQIGSTSGDVGDLRSNGLEPLKRNDGSPQFENQMPWILEQRRLLAKQEGEKRKQQEAVARAEAAQQVAQRQLRDEFARKNGALAGPGVAAIELVQKRWEKGSRSYGVKDFGVKASKLIKTSAADRANGFDEVRCLWLIFVLRSPDPGSSWVDHSAVYRMQRKGQSWSGTEVNLILPPHPDYDYNHCINSGG